ncbi:MAG: hypothetical protein A3A33_04070 [Candidatus Yanofskybacteria bacterium RIFCSPLOWO2_01_FULL_49_25]|uniref:Ribokinase n=1 Tax=Candidatus Yanofskybacteria bacterium RIFCSPLOWO2_01_FULL_49_25 TaxID=1802701 RepID=A0A1F8GTX3_9BACT|nr:MAG: hypothetical protein A3A33_04070 [Candidatus Yanofskybacteria bacterium RIFCSPLOWO2_01_FULL_49_25]
MITIIGSINMDIVARVREHPHNGETVVARSVDYIPGGKASNQAVAAARLGGTVTFVSKVGNDAFGRQLVDFLGTEGLTAKISHSKNKPSGIAIILVDPQGNNTIIVSSGADAELTVDDVASCNLKKGDIVVATLESPQVPAIYLFEKAEQNGGTTILNAAPAVPVDDQLLSLADYLVVNESELAIYAKLPVTSVEAEVIGRIKKIRQSEQQIVIATLGEHGSIALRGDDVIRVPAHRVKAVDTTGAGDCFVGALAVALSENKSLHDALAFATSAAAISVQRPGASSSMPKREEIEK